MGRLIDANDVKRRGDCYPSIKKTIANILSHTKTVKDAVVIVRCKDCKHRFVDGENVRFNVCELNHNKVQADDWFCADGERGSENERPD
jgi:hypothetical protein